MGYHFIPSFHHIFPVSPVYNEYMCFNLSLIKKASEKSIRRFSYMFINGSGNTRVFRRVVVDSGAAFVKQI